MTKDWTDRTNAEEFLTRSFTTEFDAEAFDFTVEQLGGELIAVSYAVTVIYQP